jgi:photosystem II stability/assembly factor-like uncharacterized protein
MATSTLRSVHFPVADTGYIVGERNTMLKTTNGGVTWNMLESGIVSPYLNFNSVFFSDVQHGIAVGDSCYIFKTTDGGANWTHTKKYVGAEVINLYSVYFPSASVGYASGSSSIILRTTDGGANWARRDAGIPRFNALTSLCFSNDNTGYAVASQKGTIIKTTNGGTTWTLQNAGTDYALSSVCFSDSNTAYVVGQFGTVLTSHDSGIQGQDEHSAVHGLVKVCPNPVRDKFTLETSLMTGKTQLSVFNVNGKEILTQWIIGNKTQVDMGNLPSGVYFLRLKNERAVEVGKVIKE